MDTKLSAAGVRFTHVVAQRARARRQLDQRLRYLQPLLDQRRPHRSWVRAIRDALGMSTTLLAARFRVSHSTVVGIEQSEMADTVKLETFRRVAAALVTIARS